MMFAATDIVSSVWWANVSTVSFPWIYTDIFNGSTMLYGLFLI